VTTFGSSAGAPASHANARAAANESISVAVAAKLPPQPALVNIAAVVSVRPGTGNRIWILMQGSARSFA
jgi:hypothetical protein